MTGERSFAGRWLPAVLLWATGLAGLAWLWWSGGDYYRLALLGDAQRFDLDLHADLRASGRVGHLLGIVGLALFGLNLAYLLRRHVRALWRLGKLRHWMTAHVFTGLAGFAIVVFHAGFHAGNLVHWLALGSLAVLVTTGVAGRTVYALVAHDPNGRELSPDLLVARWIEQGQRDPAWLRRRVRRSERLRRVMSIWRDFHRPMAMLMATAATVHVMTAWLSRRTWLAADPLAFHAWVFGLSGLVLLKFMLLEIFLVRRRRVRERQDLEALVDAELAGLNIPASLRPAIDLAKCVGSGACVEACPEQDVLGLVGGHAQLLHAAHCVGHGRCAVECPTGAISLVFGSTRRGVDIPHLSEQFETNVPGVFITGELGGMGLIQNAIRQSRQAIAHISTTRPRGEGPVLDLAIVGAGPAGMAAALEARQAGLRFVILEQEVAGGAIAHYPRQKVVMTAPFELPGWGRSTARLLSKEELIEMWARAMEENRIQVLTNRKVERVDIDQDHFAAVTAQETQLTRTVLLCIGRRGSPRKLGVEGEHLDKVTYRLVEPEQYRGKSVLVVGGGDAAVEAALALARAGAASVTLSYRSPAITRTREANRQAFEQAVASGQVQFEGASQVEAIGPEWVRLQKAGETIELNNDFVVVQIGGLLPLELLGQIGIQVERKFGTA
jgi:thioredoxin reductase/Pyruvate/2-oxoacid:ferredoxin oxidoreductase delta subunit